MTTTADKRIILFDGVCVLCERCVRFIIRRDRRGINRFAALQSEPGQRVLGQLKSADPALNTDGAKACARLVVRSDRLAPLSTVRQEHGLHRPRPRDPTPFYRMNARAYPTVRPGDPEIFPTRYRRAMT